MGQSITQERHSFGKYEWGENKGKHKTKPQQTTVIAKQDRVEQSREEQWRCVCVLVKKATHGHKTTKNQQRL